MDKISDTFRLSELDELSNGVSEKVLKLLASHYNYANFLITKEAINEVLSSLKLSPNEVLIDS
jgi:hypothetical protein